MSADTSPQQRAMRKSYRGVIAGLHTQLGAKLTKPQRKHYEYLLSRALGAEAKRSKIRRAYRTRVRSARRLNRA